MWHGVIEKIGWRLAGWKIIYLSKGGRIILIKSILSNLHSYFISLFALPVGLADIMEKIFHAFFWGGLGE